VVDNVLSTRPVALDADIAATLAEGVHEVGEAVDFNVVNTVGPKGGASVHDGAVELIAEDELFLFDRHDRLGDFDDLENEVTPEGALENTKKETE